ncbi:MAG: hypothetical protein JW861_07920 [Bacteroidales bacterium]|nr:hypothetical protein [Bacteroidales bacterium]
MDKTILNIFKIISIILIILAVVLQVFVLVQGEEDLMESSVLDNYALLSYIAVGLTVFLAILFPIIFMIRNPKSALKLILALVFLVVIGFICYSVSVSNFNLDTLQRLKTTMEIEKAVGASILFTYIIGGLAVLSIIYSGITGLFK